MNYIREVKQNADIVKVAELMGLQLDRRHKSKCPFHNEKTASFSVSQEKQIFKCFGCGKGGDVISLVSELLKINALESAKEIDKLLFLNISDSKVSNSRIDIYKSKQETVKEFKKWKIETFKILCDYLQLTEKIKSENYDNNKLVCEMYNNKDYVEYLVNSIYIEGSESELILTKEKKLIKRIKKIYDTLRYFIRKEEK